MIQEYKTKDLPMTSIKVKFRPSTVDGKEGGLYFQIIHNRVIRQLNTDYKVLADEWDTESESIVLNGNRSNLMLAFRSVWHGMWLVWKKLSARWLQLQEFRNQDEEIMSFIMSC